MAHTILENFLNDPKMQENEPGESHNTTQIITLSNDGQNVELPNESFVRDANITRDGVDLVLETSDGTLIIEGYYAAEPTPNLVAPDGITLTPDLVQSFTSGGNEYANAGMGTNDVSPIGAVQEISGEATVTRQNGSIETIGIGTPIYQGDIIDTDESGAVNIIFVDDTSFAVSEDARLSIDEYVFDPSTQSGTSNFSVLKGVFVFTSGLIGRDDPDDVMIDTPSGSIGIRGTIIAGDVDSGEITVIEGAIVLHDLSGNTITLSNQYETARFNTVEENIEHIGNLSANEISSKFMSVSTVAADLFSSIQDNTIQGKTNPTEQQQSDTTQDSGEVNTQPDASDETQNNSSEQQSETTSPEDSQEQTSTDNTMTSEDIITSNDIVTNAETTQQVANETSNTQQVSQSDSVEAPSLSPTITTDTTSQQVYIPPQAEPKQPTFSALMPNISGIDNFFSGSQDSLFSYNFSNDFKDPDGAIEEYALTSSPIHGDVSSFSLDQNTGIMTINLDNNVTATDTFTFTIQALSDVGNVSNTYTFDIYGATVFTGTTFITGNNDVYSGTDTSINIIANDVSAFLDGDAQNNTVSTAGDNSYIKSGDGDDIININAGSTGYHAYGDEGNDTFNISQAQGKSYGSDGNDAFVLQNATVVSDFESLSFGLKIDGGAGNDLISLAASGNIDFGAINTGLINNIETINTNNSLTNVIDLTYDSVISMTDSDNKIVIDMDNNDTLNFTNSGHTFTHQGLDDTSSYDVYTDGTVTLLVDIDHSAVNGII